MSEPDNLVLTLLREMRADMDARFDALRSDMGARFDKIERRLEMMHANGDKALRQFIGHRAMVERTMGSFEADLRARDRRVELLETAQS